MSKLLLDEQPLMVLPELATAIGLNEAIALQQLHWVRQNPRMGKDVDGMRWIRMTYKEWRIGHFPFWSEATIQRVFNSLEKKKLVQSRDDLNTLSFDRTNWYAIDDKAVERAEHSIKKNERVVEHRKMIDAHSNMKNASPQNETTIPDTSSTESSIQKSLSKRDEKIFSSLISDLQERMEIRSDKTRDQIGELWDDYPDIDAHIHAMEQTDKYAAGFNLKYYETCLAAWWKKHKKGKPHGNQPTENESGNSERGAGAEPASFGTGGTARARRPESPLGTPAASILSGVSGEFGTGTRGYGGSP